MTTRWRDHVGLLARVALGGVLVWAGALKLGNPLGSARAVQAYDVLPFEVAKYLGYGLPWLEVAVGALLVIGLLTRANALVGTLLMAAFVVGIAQAWARGLTIDCGCFGGGGQVAASETRYGSEIARDLALALCGLWLVVRPASTWSLDRVLFGTTKELQ
ncbi:DoxX family protein [Janibacter terrae]|uniref:DoxX family protein n=1 Tax=Janibacter terrae TaxID=103817 RepID=A0ABZ2FE97_9MICO|nr:DoxX family protein [Janibacter terrae]MBA4083767.1 DoxX family membrane protein [Kytococcus sp.]HCE60103.1 DoxX family membrane protein [Janibacter terrae]